MTNTEDFFDSVLSEIPKLRDFYQNELSYWAPEKPPLTLLMSNFAREFLALDIKHGLLIKILNLVEIAINSSNDNLSNAVATGFLETLYFNYPKEDKEFFHSLLGEKTKEHIDRLANFYN
ncbi:hypothetical protein QDS01_04375 [Acinetobacter nosocomialis]|uniref:DUF7674 family protein n=1 Tax=Acinetobacter nosocomialis TaxID=106654 RepID=UPI00244B24A6|nr:hypothetical protein [Acinetobacter nosocomialis]MDH2634177.1 hypothetical protein [Acinetobacter nosocomialis]